jgi:hypothetical protein
MTTTENKVAKLEKGYKIWDSLSPIERYNKVMINFTASERKGVNGLRKMVKYIIDNGIN